MTTITTKQPSARRGGRPKGVHIAIASRLDPERLTEFEERLVRTITENPGVTHKHAWAMAKGVPREKATEGMRVMVSRALARPRVQKRLAEIRAAVRIQVTEELALDRASVVRDLLAIKDRCMQEVPVVDRHGRLTGEFRFDAAGALRALELIGRELGMFVDRKEVRAGPFEGVSDDELDTIIFDTALGAGLKIVERCGPTRAPALVNSGRVASATGPTLPRGTYGTRPSPCACE